MNPKKRNEKKGARSMIDVLQDEDSSSCIGCGKRSENYKDFRIIKISKDGRSSSCTGSLC